MVGERVDGQLLSETFAELTDTMVADFDVIDFLHVLTDRSAQLLDVSAAGLLLVDQRGELRVAASTWTRRSTSCATTPVPGISACPTWPARSSTAPRTSPGQIRNPQRDQPHHLGETWDTGQRNVHFATYG